MQKFTSLDAAERLGVSRRTVQRLVASGELIPSDKFPGATGGYLFAAAEVERVRKLRESARAS